MSDTKKQTAGQMMLDYLRAKGKKTRKAGTATTAELADVIGKPVKYTYDRLFWMEKRDGTLQSTGVGKDRVWRVALKPRKSTAPSAVGSVGEAAQDASSEAQVQAETAAPTAE